MSRHPQSTSAEGPAAAARPGNNSRGGAALCFLIKARQVRRSGHVGVARHVLRVGRESGAGIDAAAVANHAGVRDCGGGC